MWIISHDILGGVPQELRYDELVVHRCREALQTMQLENVPLEALVLGVGAYWSAVAYMETRYGQLRGANPETTSFVADGDAHYEMEGTKLLLDPYAARYSVRPVCGPRGTLLALR